MRNATNDTMTNRSGRPLDGLLFASDFDGTLLMHDRPKGRFVRGDREAIRAYQLQGGLFGICTGRPERGLMVQVPSDLRPDFIISASGATVLDGQLNVLENHTVPRDAMLELVRRWGGRAAHAPFVGAGGEYYSTARLPFPGLRHVSRYEDVPGAIQVVALGIGTVEGAKRVCEEILRDMGDVVTPNQNEGSVDVIAAGCTKGTGLLAAKRLFGARATAAVGDSYNDLPMIEAADLGFTFNRSVARVRERADVLVDTVAEALAAQAKRQGAGSRVS